MTQLMMASSRGDIEVVKKLLNAGVDPNLKDASGDTALDYAIRSKQFECLWKLTETALPTPFAKVDKVVALGEKEVLPGKLYDIFISYKSENIDLVRLIVEQLLAKGLRVWFAEYRVMMHTYESFQRLINYGIENSNFAICFTNKKYAESKYCIGELKLISKTIPKENITNVKCPEHPDLTHNYPILNECHSIDYDYDVQDIWRLISEKMGIEYEPLTFIDNYGNDIFLSWHQRFNYSIGLKGWTIIEQSIVKEPDNPISDVFSSFEWKSGNIRIEGYINVGLQGDGLHRPNKIGSIVDDRKFLELTGSFLQTGFGDNDYNFIYHEYMMFRPQSLYGVVGLHFIQIGDYGHPFFTLFDFKNNSWSRKYMIVLPAMNDLSDMVPGSLKDNDRDMGTEVEFHFHFNIQNADFEDYCRFGHLMDNVVKSLRYWI